jgi:hypothetical protein
VRKFLNKATIFQNFYIAKLLLALPFTSLKLSRIFNQIENVFCFFSFECETKVKVKIFQESEGRDNLA